MKPMKPKPEGDELDALDSLMSHEMSEDDGESESEMEKPERGGDPAAMLEKIRAELDRLEEQLNC